MVEPALGELVGSELARERLSRRGYYTWVYEQVPNDDGRIRAVLERHDLTLP